MDTQDLGGRPAPETQREQLHIVVEAMDPTWLGALWTIVRRAVGPCFESPPHEP